MKRTIPGAMLLLLLSHATATAQLVSTTPITLELDEQNWLIEMQVKNLAPRPAIVTASVIFQVLRSDSDGNTYVDSAMTWEEMSRSCAAWLKVAPRELLLPANSRRTLRVEVPFPAFLSNGEFWGTLVLSSDGGEIVTIASADTLSSFTTSSKTQDLLIPIVVRKGAVHTGVAFGEIVARQRGTKAQKPAGPPGGYSTLVLVDAKRLGNGAYRGTLTASVRRESGSEIAISEQHYSLPWDRRLQMEFPRLQDGVYILELISRSDPQKDAPYEAPIPPIVERSVRLIVQGDGIMVRELL